MLTYAQSINQSLAKKMNIDKDVYIIGEDVCDPYGGAFKVTKGLSTKYPERVINTPMSEYALTGIAAGMAMRGLKPVLEIMFGDFITICADQLINHAAKFSWMYNSKVKVPMVLRTPMGGGRGYGPTHSQTIEKMFLGIPGLKIVAPSHWHNPGELLINAIDDNNPVIFIENKTLYVKSLIENDDIYVKKDSKERYNSITLSNNNFEDADVTIITYGGMLLNTLEAATKLLETEEVLSEIIVPSYINNGKIEGIEESVKKTGRVVVIEEGTMFNGWGAEISARITEQYFEYLEAPVKRVASKDIPIGNTEMLENATIPQVEDICKAIGGLLK